MAPKPETTLPAAPIEDGSLARPFHCIQRAADEAVERGIKNVVLRGGTYFLTRPIQLTAKHSNLAFTAHEAEAPVVSGGAKLSNLEWKAHDTAAPHNIWVADVAGQV